LIRNLSILILIFTVVSTVQGQTSKSTNTFQERLFVNAKGESLRYMFFAPKTVDNQPPYPLVLWLHGGGARGDDPNLILSFGDAHGPLFFARSENQSRFPCFILAPQCPANTLWSDPFSDTPGAQIRLVIELLDSLQKEVNLDKTRLYVIGISMGGFATWDLIARYPRLFAAALPICGGGNPAKAALMINTPIWAFHGDQDDLVNVSQSRQMIQAIKEKKGNPKYSEYKGVGHFAWEPAFRESDFLSWVFAQRRTD
jgi:predicted peptidase